MVTFYLELNTNVSCQADNFFSQFNIVLFVYPNVRTVAFDSKNILASGSYDRTIKLYDKNTGDLLRTINGHGSYVETVAFDSNNILASGSYDRTIKLYYKNTGDLLRCLRRCKSMLAK